MKIICMLILIIVLSNCSRKENTESFENEIKYPKASEAQVTNNEPKYGVNFEDEKQILNESNKQGPNRRMFVTASEGLRVRDIPNLTGERIGSLNHLAEVFVIDEDKNELTIDDITGRWVLIKGDNIEGWVFNGYLSNMNRFVNDNVKEMMVDYKKENARFRNTNFYDLLETRKLSTGINDIDCYITIWRVTKNSSSGSYESRDFDFFGIKNNVIVLFDEFCWSYLINHEEAANIIKGIPYYRIGNELIFIGDPNNDGNDEIIIFASGDVAYDLAIYGVNDEYNNIKQYLMTHFILSDDGPPAIFNGNGTIKVNQSLDNTLFMECIWVAEDKNYRKVW